MRTDATTLNKGLATMTDDMHDMELRAIDPSRKRFRIYGMTPARTLFGETCLVITWGRIGHPLQQRTELFPDDVALVRRRKQLLARRLRHGYVIVTPRIPPEVSCTPRPLAKTRATLAPSLKPSSPRSASLNLFD